MCLPSARDFQCSFFFLCSFSSLAFCLVLVFVLTVPRLRYAIARSLSLQRVFKTKPCIVLISILKSVENVDLIIIIVVCNRCILDYTCITVRIIAPIIPFESSGILLSTCLAPSISQAIILFNLVGKRFFTVKIPWNEIRLNVKYKRPSIYIFAICIAMVFNQNVSHKKSN